MKIFFKENSSNPCLYEYEFININFIINITKKPLYRKISKIIYKHKLSDKFKKKNNNKSVAPPVQRTGYRPY